MADATPRVSAQIIPFPNAAPAPVVQRSGAGRRPRNVVSLRRFRIEQWDRRMAEHRAAAQANARIFVGQLDRIARTQGKDALQRHVNAGAFAGVDARMRDWLEGFAQGMAQSK